MSRILIPEPNDEMRNFILDLDNHIRPLIQSTLVPIIGYNGSISGQYGTGTLFRVASFSFMVTAFHVLRDIKRDKMQMRILDGNSNDNVHVNSIPIITESFYYGEPCDIAIVPLNDEQIAGLPNRTFLSLAQTALLPEFPGGCYLAGFPSVLATPAESNGLVVNPFCLLTNLYQGHLSLDNYDERYHFALIANRTDFTDIQGEPARVPERLGGISGCSVWQVTWPKKVVNPSNAKIVGIQISTYNGRPQVIKGTNWWAVVQLLIDHDPSLRIPIEFHYGQLPS